MAQRILIDFDGVLFKNDRVSRLVRDRSIDFVQKSLNVSRREAERVNATWYPLHGHTALVIRHEPDTRKTVRRYNRYVFDEALFESVSECIDDFDRYHLERIACVLQRRGTKNVHLCTNAPFMYCEQVLQELGYSTSDLFDSTHVFTSDEGLVKPLDAYWDHVDRSLPNQPIRFLDDSAVHVLSTAIRPNWTSVWVQNDVHLFSNLDS